MNVLILEPYFTGSHAQWADGYKQHSKLNVEILGLPGQFWKWRMHGGAVSLAKKFLARAENPDLIVATDMLDVTTFLALTRARTSHIPIALYFHENQLCYPWSPTDRDVLHKRDKHYAFINYTSALAANNVFFNSEYHRNSFLDELSRFLRHFPDHKELANIDVIARKSRVLHLGLDLSRFDSFESAPKDEAEPALLLWNHRWEYDKNPADFFRALQILHEKGIDFRIAVLGENFSKCPDDFEQAKGTFGDKIIRYGYAENFEEYAAWLLRADILPVTSNQDFFGASVVEAIYCGCYPILPQRQTYPELIPLSDFPNNFYSDFDDLVPKLEAAIQNINSTRRTNLRPVVEQFSWRNMAPIYDDLFGRIINIKNTVFNTTLNYKCQANRLIR